MTASVIVLYLNWKENIRAVLSSLPFWGPEANRQLRLYMISRALIQKRETGENSYENHASCVSAAVCRMQRFGF